MNIKISYYFIMLGLFSLSAVSPAVAIEKGQPAPSITLKYAQQQNVLSDYKGSVVYLDFWASWCKPCRRSFPWMNDMHQKYANQGLKVVAINLDAEPDLIAQFLDKVPAKFPIAFDAEGTTAETYEVMGMPSSYLIDRNGVLRAIHQGFFVDKQAKYEKEIQTLLAEKG